MESVSSPSSFRVNLTNILIEIPSIGYGCRRAVLNNAGHFKVSTSESSVMVAFIMIYVWQEI